MKDTNENLVPQDVPQFVLMQSVGILKISGKDNSCCLIPPGRLMWQTCSSSTHSVMDTSVVSQPFCTERIIKNNL